VENFSQLQQIVATAFHEFCFLACSTLLLFLPVSAQELPAGTTLEVRLSGPTGSRISHRGDPIEATVIAPVSAHGRILVPQGSRLHGSVANATAIGLGLKHSTARIGYAFHTLQLPDGAAIAISTQLVEVETAKEGVDALGTVHGIHPIASLSSTLAFYTFPLLVIDPTVGVPVWGVKSLIAPSADPEIHFPTSTELILRLTNAVPLPASNSDFPVPAKSFSRGDLTSIEHWLKISAQRAYMGGRPSDIVNVLLIGSRSQMDRAFHASGWSQAQQKSPMSLYRMYHALSKRHGYPRAPMNTLTLNGVPSTFVRQKSLNTVQKRHHVRLWQHPLRADIWLGTAAEDVGFRFELTHWTHSTNSHIDGERAKVVNDLVFTGCVDSAGLLSRAPTDLVQDPKAEYPIVTDGDVAVVQLNDCIHPNLMAGAGGTSVLHRRGRLARALTAFRDDLVRSNIVFTTYNTLKFLAKRKAEPATAHASPINVQPRGLDWLSPTAPPQSRPGQ
jgi:LssY-like putative type I secretion system component LssY